MKIRKEKEKKNGKDGIFRDILIEIRDSIIFNILIFIPRMMIRLIKNIF